MADKTGRAWSGILAKHPDIEQSACGLGYGVIQAKEIKEFREPRLMAKHDTSAAVPDPLRKRGLNILPISRTAYALGDFEVFEPFPSMEDEKPKMFSIPELETLDLRMDSHAQWEIRDLALKMYEACMIQKDDLEYFMEMWADRNERKLDYAFKDAESRESEDQTYRKDRGR